MSEIVCGGCGTPGAELCDDCYREISGKSPPGHSEPTRETSAATSDDGNDSEVLRTIMAGSGEAPDLYDPEAAIRHAHEARVCIEPGCGEPAKGYTLEGLPACRAHKQALGAVLKDLPKVPRLPLLLDRLHPTEESILFGTGGSGKGSLSSYYTVRLTADGLRVAILDFEDHLGEWQERIGGLGGDLAKVLYYPNLDPLPGIAGDLRQEFDGRGVDYVVIDSVVMALGGIDPLKPEAPIRYAKALHVMRRPSLSLAHVTKETDHRYPFGSVFWHNGTRLTLSLEARASGVRILQNRKANQHRLFGKFEVRLDFDQSGVLCEVSDRTPYLMTDDGSVEEVMEPGVKYTRTQLRDLAGMSSTEADKESFKKVLQRAKANGTLTFEGDDWRTELVSRS
jgi:hypothetical protein